MPAVTIFIKKLIRIPVFPSQFTSPDAKIVVQFGSWQLVGGGIFKPSAVETPDNFLGFVLGDLVLPHYYILQEIFKL